MRVRFRCVRPAWNVFERSQNDDEPAFPKKAGSCVFAHHAPFFVVIDPLVAQPVFFQTRCRPRENSRLEFVFLRLFLSRSDRVLLSTVRGICLSTTKPARNPKKVDSFARYGPYDFGGLRSFMVDPSCLDQ